VPVSERLAERQGFLEVLLRESGISQVDLHLPERAEVRRLAVLIAELSVQNQGLLEQDAGASVFTPIADQEPETA
jgi:hypothetical protein